MHQCLVRFVPALHMHVCNAPACESNPQGYHVLAAAEDVRRTSVGVALVTGVHVAPSVLLLDSPTAGLPAAAGNRIMRTLKVRNSVVCCADCDAW